MKALIVANGTINNIHLLKECEKEYDFILAADGGTNHCIKAGILPDLIIGDLDSISNNTLKVSKEKDIKIEKFPVKKDSTDTDLSIDYLIDKGYKEITLIGVTGSRMDHTLGNILLLNKLNDSGVKGKIIDDNNIIYLVDDELELSRELDLYVSIIPLTNNGINVSLEGFEYELEFRNVEYASTFCISNKIIEERARITVHEGKALVFLAKD